MDKATHPQQAPANLAEDLLSGIREIAEFIGEEERRTYHLVATRQIPAFKLGGRYCSTRSRIRAHVNAMLEGGEVA